VAEASLEDCGTSSKISLPIPNRNTSGGGFSNDSTDCLGVEDETEESGGVGLLHWLKKNSPGTRGLTPKAIEERVSHFLPNHPPLWKGKEALKTQCDSLWKGEYDDSPKLHPQTLETIKYLLCVDHHKQPTMQEAFDKLRLLEVFLWEVFEAKMTPPLQVVTPILGVKGSTTSFLLGSGEKGKQCLVKSLGNWRRKLEREGGGESGRLQELERKEPLKILEDGKLIVRFKQEEDRLWVLQGVMEEYLKDDGVFDKFLKEQHTDFERGGASLGGALGGTSSKNSLETMGGGKGRSSIFIWAKCT